jgi:hypothetical protein
VAVGAGDLGAMAGGRVVGALGVCGDQARRPPGDDLVRLRPIRRLNLPLPSEQTTRRVRRIGEPEAASEAVEISPEAATNYPQIPCHPRAMDGVELSRSARVGVDERPAFRPNVPACIARPRAANPSV